MKFTTSWRGWIAAAFCLALGGAASSAVAATPVQPPAAPTIDCAALAKGDFSAIPEAPTQVLVVKTVAAADTVPAYCEVLGAVMPNVGFKLKMPVASWNGRFFLAGCGNYCGIVYPKACDEPLRRGYACVATDSGHVARPEDVNWTDGQWAYDNLEAELDWGGRATHVTAVASKAITETYYGKAPLKSIYMGCSYGGHQAMVLAQRYPWDFDGIVGGGVPNRISQLMQQNTWALTTAYNEDFTPKFSEADIQVLHTAVLADCDMDDGIKDGLLTNPGACRPNVDKLICAPGKTEGCISKEIADVAKKAYAGPTNSKGEALSAGGWAPGSELWWRKVYRPDGTGLAALARNYFRYMGRYPDVGPKWSPKDYDFDRDYKRDDVMETLYGADNPDLRRFKAAGGKLINYVGWNDLGTTPGVSIDYYETTQKTMGGPAATKDFFRMFLIPGALHCRGGEGPHSADFFTAIEDWVDKDKAPEMVVGSHPKDGGGVDYTRPIYAYPMHAMYKGSGDSNDAANFKSVGPR